MQYSDTYLQDLVYDEKGRVVERKLGAQAGGGGYDLLTEYSFYLDNVVGNAGTLQQVETTNFTSLEVQNLQYDRWASIPGSALHGFEILDNVENEKLTYQLDHLGRLTKVEGDPVELARRSEGAGQGDEEGLVCPASQQAGFPRHGGAGQLQPGELQ